MSQTTEVICLNRDLGQIEVDPKICIHLNDLNTAEENIVIPSYEQFKNSLTFDILSPTSLTQVPSFILKKFPKVEMLRLMNAGIKSLNVDNFAIGNEVKDLDLRRNLITFIPNGVFANLTSLEQINLANNRINYIAPGAFDHLTDLKILFLSNNELETLESDSLTGAIKLTELYLESNKINHIDAGALDLPKLEVLSLKNNQLSSLSSDVFQHAIALEKIDLGNNDLQEINQLFEKCTNIYSLGLNNNPNLRDINIFELTDRLPNLSFLYLANTGFRLSIEHQSIADEPNQSLTHLDLSGNQLSDSKILSHLQHFKSLKTLILSRNNLKYLDQLAVVRSLFPQIEKIDLSENANIDIEWIRHAKTVLKTIRIKIVTDLDLYE